MAIYCCDVCGSSYSKRGNAVKGQKHHFCSMNCRRIFEGREIVACQVCGVSFYKKRAERKSRPMHFCSSNCYRAYQRQQMITSKVCPVCNTTFEPSGYGAMRYRQVYCSHECKGIAHRGANNPAWLGGHPSYRGPDWPIIQRQALELDDNKCVLCGTGMDLNVHHIEPYRISQNNNFDNLATLCDRCHGIADRDYLRGKASTEQAIRLAIKQRC